MWTAFIDQDYSALFFEIIGQVLAKGFSIIGIESVVTMILHKAKVILYNYKLKSTIRGAEKFGKEVSPEKKEAFEEVKKILIERNVVSDKEVNRIQQISQLKWGQSDKLSFIDGVEHNSRMKGSVPIIELYVDIFIQYGFFVLYIVA